MLKMKTYILLDRSGSMQTNWIETMGAMTTFIEGLKKKSKVHFAAFDGSSHMEYKVILDGKRKDFDVAVMDANPPRGNTPLYDATGELSKVIAHENPDKAQIVIITDGYENASREWTQDGVKTLVKGWEHAGYDVVYMGASFKDAVVQSAAMGIHAGKTVNMADSAAYGETMTAMSTRNTAYASGSTSGEDDLEDDIRKAADGK